MRRSTTVVAVISAFVIGALAAGAAGYVIATARPAQSSLLATVVQRGELRVCTTGDDRPFTHRDATGAHTGIDVEMGRNLAASLGVPATFVPVTWSSLVDTVTSGGCDIGMGGVSVTLARAQKAAFAEPIMVDGKAAIARCADKPRFPSLAAIDQPGVRLVVNPGGTNEAFATSNIHRATVLPHPDNNTIFDEIVAGRADVMITDVSETRFQAKLHPELCPVNPDAPFTYAEKAYLLPQGDAGWQAYVDQWVRQTTHDGTYAGLTRTWFG
jgi:cyclohexadienyl dehydratase